MGVKEEKRLHHALGRLDNEISVIVREIQLMLPRTMSLPPSATATTTTTRAPKSIAAAAATKLLKLAGNNLIEALCKVITLFW
jgi:hypothetical protein